MRKHLLNLFIFSLPIFGFSQIFSEVFDDITTLNANGWTMSNLSSPIGSTNWFQGNPTIFESYSGATNSYIGANYNNTANIGTISNWLVTPSINVKDGDKVSFFTRTDEGSLWNDRLEFRSSTGTLAMPTDTNGVGSFTNLLLTINENYDLTYPETWTKFEIIISGVGTIPIPMNFAFRYNVLNGGPNGTESNYIGIDDFKVIDGIVEPTECDPVDVPYYQDFETATIPALPDCTSRENVGTGNKWDTAANPGYGFTSKTLRYYPNPTNAANTWFYTNGINLVAGTEYKITYDYSTAAATENLKVAYGTDNANANMTNVLADHPNISTNGTPTTNVVNFTPTTSGVYYFGFNAYSAANMSYLLVDNIKIELVEVEPPIEGCLDAPNGQFPMTTYTPLCIGMPEPITTNAKTGEYSKISLSAGTEYTFSSSIATDFITISDENGSIVKAFGSSPLVYTPTTDEVVRFYTHVDENCLVDGTVRTRFIQCGEPVIIEEPDFYCIKGTLPSNELGDSFPIKSNSSYRVADDIYFDYDIPEFEVLQIGIDTNQPEIPDFATIRIREDNNGSPGDVIETIAMAPTQAIAYTIESNQPVYHLIFELDTPILILSGTHWIDVTMTTPNQQDVNWISTDNNSSDSPNNAQFSSDYGNSWEETGYYNMSFYIGGNCTYISVNDLNQFDFDYYPNPTKDILNIDSEKTVKKVEIFNLAGQKIQSNAKLNNGQINLNHLTPGTYVFKVTLEGGQIETFKIIKK